MEIANNFEDTLTRLEAAGHSIVDIELPVAEYSLATYYIIMPAEASTNLARYDGVRYGLYKEGSDLFEDYARTRGIGFGAEVRRRILLGTYVLSAGYLDAYYYKAQSVRALITKSFEDAFSKVDAIATPTAPSVAFKIGEKSDPLSMYLSDFIEFTTKAQYAYPSKLTICGETPLYNFLLSRYKILFGKLIERVYTSLPLLVLKPVCSTDKL